MMSKMQTRRFTTRAFIFLGLVLLGTAFVIPTIYYGANRQTAEQRMSGRLASTKNQLELAVREFALEFDSRPPASNRQEILEFFDRHFGAATDCEAALLSSGLNLDDMDEYEALVFWLGGIQSPEARGNTVGFPFSRKSGVISNPDDRQPIYMFEEHLLIDADGDGWLEYAVRGGAKFYLHGSEIGIGARELAEESGTGLNSDK